MTSGIAQRGAADVVEHARFGIEHLVLILREVFGDNIVSQADRTGRRQLRAGEQLDERRLARAIDANKRHAVTTIDGEARAGEHLFASVALRKSLGLGDHASRWRWLRKFEVNDRLLFGNLNALDFFQFLDP